MNDDYDVISEFGIFEDGLTGMEITDNPLNGNEQRQDKGVILRAAGKEEQISSIMLGYNKQGIKLSNGFFVSVDEVKNAIVKAINSTGENTKIFSKKTGKTIDMKVVDKIIKEASLAAGKMVVSEGYDTIKNTDSRKRTIQGAHNGPIVNSPVLLSKNGLQLPCGEYVSFEEISAGLKEYVVETQKSVPTPPTTSQPQNNKNYIVRVTNKYKSKLSTILLMISVLIMLISGQGKDIEKVNRTIVLPQQFSEIQYQIKEYDGVKVIIDGQECDFEFKMGESEYIMNDTPVTEYGNGKGNRYVVGKEEFNSQNKFEDEYDITGFAITLPNGKVYYSEKFDNNKPTNTNIGVCKESLNDFIIEVLKKYPELSINDLDISIHFGSNTNNTRLGWISINDLQNLGKYTFKYDRTLPNTYSGVINNHKGDNISINTSNGIVQIPIKNGEGKIYQNGTIVYGSDNQIYVLGSVVEEKNIVTTTKEVTEEKSSIVWKISNCNYLAASLPAVAALASMIAEKKKNEKEKRNPKFEKFESEEEYRKFLGEFQKQRSEYESKSKLVRWIMQKKSYAQRLTDDQVIQIYSMIKTKYGFDAEIKIENGKFVVIKPDGVIEQIDSGIISEINKIGEDNPYVGRTK